MTFSPFTFASTSLSLGAFDNSGIDAPKRYDALGNDVGAGNGTYAIVMRYDPACASCEKYVPSEGSSVVKVALAAHSALALGQEGEGEAADSAPSAARVEGEAFAAQGAGNGGVQEAGQEMGGSVSGSHEQGDSGDSESGTGTGGVQDAGTASGQEPGAVEAAGKNGSQEGCAQDQAGAGDVVPAAAALAPAALLPAFIMRPRRRIRATVGEGERASAVSARSAKGETQSGEGEGA